MFYLLGLKFFYTNYKTFFFLGFSHLRHQSDAAGVACKDSFQNVAVTKTTNSSPRDIHEVQTGPYADPLASYAPCKNRRHNEFVMMHHLRIIATCIIFKHPRNIHRRPNLSNKVHRMHENYISHLSNLTYNEPSINRIIRNLHSESIQTKT